MKTLLHEQEIREEGREAGLRDGIRQEIFTSVQDGDYGIERGAQKIGISVEEMIEMMKKAGYKVPVA